jgi:hypothetical protein
MDVGARCRKTDGVIGTASAIAGIKPAAQSDMHQQAGRASNSSTGDGLPGDTPLGAAVACFVQLTGSTSSLNKNNLIVTPKKKLCLSESMEQLRNPCSTSGGGTPVMQTELQQPVLKRQSDSLCSSSEANKTCNSVTQQQLPQQVPSSSLVAVRHATARAALAAAAEPAREQQAVPQIVNPNNLNSPKLVSPKSVGRRSALAACASALAATVKWVDLPHRAKQKQQQQQQQNPNQDGKHNMLRHAEGTCNPSAGHATGLTCCSASLPLAPGSTDASSVRNHQGPTGAALKAIDGAASNSSFSSSTLKPYPPSGGCSPQKQRPGTVLRQASASAVTAAASAAVGIPCRSNIAGSSRSCTEEDPRCLAAAATAGKSMGKRGQQRLAVASSNTASQAAAGGCSNGSAAANIDSLTAAAAAAMAASGGGSAFVVPGSSSSLHTPFTPGVAEVAPTTSRLKAPAAACVPIAVAKHCPQDLNGHHW